MIIKIIYGRKKDIKAYKKIKINRYINLIGDLDI
jgi:hypothetical protein